MNEAINLQYILPLDELKKNGEVLLARHYHPNLSEMKREDLIEEYQGFQHRPAFKKCKYLITFLAGERNTGIFYGIYEITNILEDREVPLCSKELSVYYTPVKDKTYIFLVQKKLNEYDKYKDRLVIDWVVPRGWYNNYGEVKDKPVIRILPPNFVKDFPGLMNVKLTFPELQKIIDNPDSHEEWFNSLSRLQAVYLILDTKSGYQYIGTTYGENGLWQRWESYAKGDHTGGNIEFINLLNDRKEFYLNFQFSILEVLSKTSDQKYCTEKESNWKGKLGSRAFGLNKN